MLQYRLLVDVENPRQDIKPLIWRELESWLRNKNLDPAALREGARAELAPHAHGRLIRHEHSGGGQSVRAVITENNASGRWETRLTLHLPRAEEVKPWLWLDLDGPEHVSAAVPNLARNLLASLETSAHGVRGGEATVITSQAEVGELVEAVCDRDRRSLLFVAASEARHPLEAWHDRVRRLLRDCAGLAGGFVLSPEATAVFNNAIGPAHQVRPWTVRTYQPRVEVDDLDDARRHRVLGMQRIADDPVQGLARMLGKRAREAVLRTPLPRRVATVESAFAHRGNDELLTALSIAPAPRPRDGDAVAPPAPSRVEPAATGSAGPARLVLPEAAQQALELVLGTGFTAEAILELGAQAETYRHRRDQHETLTQVLHTRTTEVEALRETTEQLTEQINDIQLELTITTEANTAAQTEIRRLRALLSSAGQAADAWATPPADPRDKRPEDCDELAGRLSEFEHVEFTGALDPLLELGQHNSVDGWAGIIWDVLGVLEDYARACLEGAFEGNVGSYLANTPAGYRTFTANRHAPDETPQLQSNAQMWAARCFPVPAAVDPSERVFMGAHFKIARYGSISPRLHYANDIRGTQRIYVGYCGRHLLNFRTD